MVVRGRVQNGVVVLEGGVNLPEGQEVTVLARGPALDTPRTRATKPHSFLDIPPIRLGSVLLQLTADDDLLGEMLEDRQ
jgi:hypothetical protein